MYITVKSDYYATNYEHIHVEYASCDYLESNLLPATVPLSVDQNYPSARPRRAIARGWYYV